MGILLIPVNDAVAGSSKSDTASYAEFAQELRQYLPNNIILPLFSKLPPGGDVYGYDLGDLTRNGKTDLVVSLKKPKARWNEVFIYFFTNQDDAFELVKVLVRKYNQDPLEVAFYIEDATCFITDKIGENHWQVDGYTIEQFVFRLVYQWENRPLPGGRYGLQLESDYRTMEATEFLYKIEDMAPLLKNTYLTIPAYPSGMAIPNDLSYVIADTANSMVLAGVSNWSGPEDCSLSVFARYDTSELTLSAVVYDDVISGGSAGDLRDEMEFWLDCNNAQKLIYKQGAYVMDAAYDPGTLGISVATDSLGVFSRLSVRYSGFTKKQQQQIERISSTAVMLRGGAILIRCRVPLELLDKNAMENDIGFAASYYDVDRYGEQVWISHLATSSRFEGGVPYTFGRLKFVGRRGVPFERDDFRMRPLLKELTNVGVLPR